MTKMKINRGDKPLDFINCHVCNRRPTYCRGSNSCDPDLVGAWARQGELSGQKSDHEVVGYQDNLQYGDRPLDELPRNDLSWNKVSRVQKK